MSNSYSNFEIIRVTPTISTDAYSVNDVFFTATEIPNAVLGNGGCSKLVDAYLIDQASQAFSAFLLFSENNTALGTINATADIADGDLEAMNITGMCRVLDAQAELAGALDTSNIHKIIPASGTDESANPVQLLQAAAGSTSVAELLEISTAVPSSTPSTYNL